MTPGLQHDREHEDLANPPHRQPDLALGTQLEPIVDGLAQGRNRR